MDVPCVSADSAFCSSSPHGITDEALFWEHLHPRARGYYLIADLFLKQALDNPRWLGENAPGAFARRLPYQTDTLGICWLDMAYADLSMQNLARKWPFTSYPVRPVVLDSADTVLKQIALDVYTEKLTWVEGCYRTSTHFQRTGHARQAATTYQALTDEYPRNFYAHYLLGNLYKSTGDLSKAITQYESCIAINPQYPFARVDLGLIRINEGRFDEALDQLSAAERITAEGGPPALRASIFYGLSGAYANKGEYAKALHYVDESLKLAPTYRAAQSLRAQLLFHH
jgi:tetratricopeptide (TPR) repeat protein